jgi:hypothetical protein
MGWGRAVENRPGRDGVHETDVYETAVYETDVCKTVGNVDAKTDADAGTKRRRRSFHT